MKVLKTRAGFRSAFSNRFETVEVPSNHFETLKEKVTTIAPFNSFDFPLLVNKTQCPKCKYIAESVEEAEAIKNGECVQCEQYSLELQTGCFSWDIAGDINRNGELNA